MAQWSHSQDNWIWVSVKSTITCTQWSTLKMNCVHIPNIHKINNGRLLRRQCGATVDCCSMYHCVRCVLLLLGVCVCVSLRVLCCVCQVLPAAWLQHPLHLWYRRVRDSNRDQGETQSLLLTVV